jgi:PAS domain S-box-containing protein
MSQSGTPADAPAEQDTETTGQAVTDRDAVPAAPAASTMNVPTGEEFTSVARQLFLGHPLPMWVCNVETLRIVEVNDAAIETYGYARAEFLTMRVTDFRLPEDVEHLHHRIAEIEPDSTSRQRPARLWRHIYKDGTIHDIDVMSRRLVYAGRPADLVMATDVTERIRTEHERDALLARLGHEVAQRTAILEQMTDAVIVADANGRVTLANKAARDLFDVTDNDWPDIVRGQQTWHVYDTDGIQPPVADLPFTVALGGNTIRGAYRIVLPDGRQRWISASAGPLRAPDDELQGIVWVARDTTEERDRHEREARGEKLRALGQMASGVAHDLNQYLGMVAGYGDLAMRALQPPTPDLNATREALDVVVHAAMDGADTVKRLLSFGRPSQEGPAAPLDMGVLLREVATLMAPRWRDAAQQQGRPISMLVEVSGDTTVLGWAPLLREALTNLIFNAVDALHEGGTIRLAAQRDGDRVAVDVSDTGVGIPADALAHVFEPFFTTKGARGTGLGLAIVYGAAERHEATITANSVLGQGATFSLKLPAASPAPPIQQKPPVVATSTGRRILVVDDEPAITRMVRMMLAPHGHTVMTVSSGEEALARLAEAELRFDLILSDLGLGAGINGWELLERVRAEGWTTPFVLSTGWGAQIDLAEAASRGAHGVLAKPYRLADVLAIVAASS